MDDSGARNLIAAILRQAHDDIIETKACPDFCTMKETCDSSVADKNYCEAKKFIHSAWCASLCEGIELPHKQYEEYLTRRNKLARETYRYIESELRNYRQTCRELESLKRDIILATPQKQEGTSYQVGDPTQNKAASIIQDRRIQRYEQIVKAIKTVYDQCDDQKKKLIETKYWLNRYKDEGIIYHLGVGRATFYRWKDAIVYAIAIELGYL
jgi:RinA family phage transcriptional activator